MGMNKESGNQMERYQRQMLLPQFGRQGQEKLMSARVLVIGAGGLGCPALLYLAAAGVGTLGIVDFDRVALSNLHRQILYGPDDIGLPKADVAAQKLRKAYPDTTVEVFDTRLDTQNALEIISGYDLVVDGSDNFPTRYLVNDACVLLDKPLVWGSVYRFEGQVAVFNHQPTVAAIPDEAASEVAAPKTEKINYRDLFPTPPGPDEIPNCAEAGVLGVLPGIIGSLQANEAIKVLTGLGDPLVGRLLSFDARQTAFYEFLIFPHPDAQLAAPKDAQAFTAMNYAHFCGHPRQQVQELAAEAFDELARQPQAMLLDVRNPSEEPKMAEHRPHSIPLPELEDRMQELEAAATILIFCQAGARSLQAAHKIQARYPGKEVYSLKGGIMGWQAYQAGSKQAGS
jgi:sulfur-carrier protein adenylyltransferase/sulfurtransferase